MNVEVNNLTTLVVDEGFLISVAKKVLMSENKKDAELSIALVGQGRIRELNRKYRGKNRVTDILSFPDEEGGELVICLSEVKRNAKKYKLTFQQELAKVLIHGTLHLLEYEHEKTRVQADKMAQKEEHYISRLEF